MFYFNSAPFDWFCCETCEIRRQGIGVNKTYFQVLGWITIRYIFIRSINTILHPITKVIDIDAFPTEIKVIWDQIMESSGAYITHDISIWTIYLPQCQWESWYSSSSQFNDGFLHLKLAARFPAQILFWGSSMGWFRVPVQLLICNIINIVEELKLVSIW